MGILYVEIVSFEPGRWQRFLADFPRHGRVVGEKISFAERDDYDWRILHHPGACFQQHSHGDKLLDRGSVLRKSLVFFLYNTVILKFD